MPLLYTSISRGSTVLAKYASCAGNFSEVTEMVFEKMSPQEERFTYIQGNYHFHYINENNIIYLCIADDQFERSRAFLYLNEIKRRFLIAYGSSVEHAMAYAMNTDFSRILANEMKHYSESHDIDTISRVHGELDELKDIMVANIDNISKRGEHLELLVDKTTNLSNNAVNFRATSRHLARSMFWKSVKMYVVIGLVSLLVLYFIVSMACGGLAWQSCVNKK